jgi:ABC-type amino acid transport substrate-binding protein
MELNSGNIDCIWNGFTINGREDSYTWSPAYVNNSQVMVVKADAGIETLADLAGKNVVVQAASAALDVLNSEEKAELTIDKLNKVIPNGFGYEEIPEDSLETIYTDTNFNADQYKNETFSLVDDAYYIVIFGSARSSYFFPKLE